MGACRRCWDNKVVPSMCFVETLRIVSRLQYSPASPQVRDRVDNMARLNTLTSAAAQSPKKTAPDAIEKHPQTALPRVEIQASFSNTILKTSRTHRTLKPSNTNTLFQKFSEQEPLKREKQKLGGEGRQLIPSIGKENIEVETIRLPSPPPRRAQTNHIDQRKKMERPQRSCSARITPRKDEEAENTEEESSDLDGFIVDDDEEISIYEDALTGLESSSDEEPSPPPPTVRRRRLVRGRRPDRAVESPKPNEPTTQRTKRKTTTIFDDDEDDLGIADPCTARKNKPLARLLDENEDSTGM